MLRSMAGLAQAAETPIRGGEAPSKPQVNRS